MLSFGLLVGVCLVEEHLHIQFYQPFRALMQVLCSGQLHRVRTIWVEPVTAFQKTQYAGGRICQNWACDMFKLQNKSLS